MTFGGAAAHPDSDGFDMASDLPAHPITPTATTLGPRPRRRGSSRGLVLIGAGLVGGGLLLFVVSQIDRTDAGGDRPASRIKDAKDVLEPSQLTEAERANASGELSIAQLEQGAWVQVADEQGRLAQQYSADSVNPLPERELDLVKPRAIFYQTDGRVIQLSADQGRARVPKKALERGTLTGHVKIRVFRPTVGADGTAKPVDVSIDPPVIEVDAEDAHFDSIEIRCEGRIDLASEMGSFHGRGLSMILDPKSGQLDSLFIEKCTEPIRFVRRPDGRMRPEGAREVAAAPSERPAPAPPTAPDDGDRAPARDATAPKETPQPQRAANSGATSPKREETRFFQLVLQHDVEVIRTKAGRTTTLRGDLLRAIFAMEGGSAFNVVSGAELGPSSGAPRSFARTPHSPLAFVAANALAANAITLGTDDETITITYSGPLELRPTGERLATTDDVRVELESSERTGGRGFVELDDEHAKAHVTCWALRFDSQSDRVDAEGTASRPLDLVSPRLKARGERFWLDQGVGRGGFVGPGQVTLASGGEFFAPLSVDPSAADVTKDASGAAHATVAIDANAAAPSTVNLAWTDALDLQFAGGDATPRREALDTGDLRGAHFKGDVVATGDSFRLNAADLNVTFGTPPAGADAAGSLERIVATGSEGTPARARRTDGKGELSARSLDLALRPDAKRGAAPATLLAEGAVMASDGVGETRDQSGNEKERGGGQTLWTSSLSVTFLDSGQRVDRPANALGPDAMAEEIAKVEGRDGVQVRLANADLGATPSAERSIPVRVFADTLDGNGVDRTLVVAGSDVWVVRDTVVADRMKRIEFDERSRTGQSSGEGRLRVFGTRTAAGESTPSIGAALEHGSSSTNRVERPELPSAASLIAEWTGGFRFEEKTDLAPHGALEVHQDVHVRSTPDRSASDGVDAAWLRLELDDPARRRGGDASSGAAAAGLRRVVARGIAPSEAAPVAQGAMARFESLRWTSAAREGDPRVLRLDGELIDFDLVRQEGTVTGRGRLFVHVPANLSDAGPTNAVIDAPAAGETTIASRPFGLGVVGSTLFTWQRELRLIRLATADGSDHAVAPQFTVVLDEAVEVTHADTAKLVMTAARLEADFERLDGERVQGAQASAGTDPMGVALGGTAKLLQIRAISAQAVQGLSGANETGRITIITDDFTIECDSFIYDATRQWATLTAVAGSSVVVVPVKEPTRRLASIVEWNLATGTLRIKDARGG